jgi:hypothetical protein
MKASERPGQDHGKLERLLEREFLFLFLRPDHRLSQIKRTTKRGNKEKKGKQRERDQERRSRTRTEMERIQRTQKKRQETTKKGIGHRLARSSPSSSSSVFSCRSVHGFPSFLLFNYPGIVASMRE